MVAISFVMILINPNGLRYAFVSPIAEVGVGTALAVTVCCCVDTNENPC